jgi:segregation and condensation protein B
MSDTPVPPPDESALRSVLEALVYAAEEPLTQEDLRDLFPAIPEETLEAALDAIERACQAPDRGLQVRRVAGGYRMTTKPEVGEWVRALFRSRNRRRLSAAALETLAIVAYRQPVTTPEIQALRGTDPSGVLQNLLEKRLVRVLGRKKVVGKPILYGTTREFLSHFGLNSLADLPSMEEFGALAASLPAGPDEQGPSGPFEEAPEGDGEDGSEEEYEDDRSDEAERDDDGDDS